MKRKVFSAILVMFLFFSLTKINYAQNNKDVEVIIPTSNVRINGTVINNKQNKYPMIFYKDIFYLPLTNGYSSALGLITSWYRDEEFIIVQDYSSDAPIQDLSEDNDLNTKHYATVLDTNIRINEEEIVNSQEEYPFLILKDTVYMPVTSKYVNKFGWKVSFEEEGGLDILVDPLNIFETIIVDDWIYVNEYFKMYKMKVDGSQKTMFADAGSVSEMIINGEWIYYINGDDDWKIYKIKTDGTEKTKLTEENTADLIGMDSNIYYTRGENYSYSKPNPVYKMDLDGSEGIKIDNLELGFFSSRILNDGWIYYTDIEDDDKLYKIRTNGKDKTKLTDEGILYPQIIGEWIFYFDISDYHIYKIKLDGSRKTRITEEKPYSYIIDGDWMYYKNREDKGTLYKIRLDGSEKRKLNSHRSDIIDVQHDWIYYEDYLGQGIYPVSLARVNINNNSREVLLPNGPTKYYYIDGQKIEENNSGEWLFENLKLSYTDSNDNLASSIEIIKADSSKVSFVKHNSDYMRAYSNISLHEIKIDKESERIIHTSNKENAIIYGLDDNERYIKWEELYRDGEEYFVDVYLYDLESNKKITVKERINNSLHKSFYRIHTSLDDNYIVWLENHQDNRESYVKLYDLTSEEEKTIATINFTNEDDSRRIPVTFVDIDNGSVIFDEKTNSSYYYNIYDIEKEKVMKRSKLTNNVVAHLGGDYDSENDLLAIYFASEDSNGFYGELGYVDLKRNKYYKINKYKSYEMIYEDRIQLKNGFLAYNIQKYVSGYIYDNYSGYIFDVKKGKNVELDGSFEAKIFENYISNLYFDKQEGIKKINYEIMGIDKIFNPKDVN